MQFLAMDLVSCSTVEVAFRPLTQIMFSPYQRFYYYEQTVTKLTEQAVRLLVSLKIVRCRFRELAMSKLLCDSKSVDVEAPEWFCKRRMAAQVAVSGSQSTPRCIWCL